LVACRGAGGIARIAIAVAQQPGIVGGEIGLIEGRHVALAHLSALAQHLVAQIAQLLDTLREDARLADILAVPSPEPATVAPRSALVTVKSIVRVRSLSI
jgi:hypothetical protein